ncbi:hypothetical protein HYI43_03510 [Staphylococcus taiwanensis]|nr:hypothetical protein HYI43_03510 [Staphylococcus taiwanensis]
MTHYLINYQQNLIILMTAIEKIKYYYFMDFDRITSALDEYNQLIQDYEATIQLDDEVTIINAYPLSPASPNDLYYQLLTALSSHPLHIFQQGALIADLNQLQHQIYRTLLKIKDLQNDL